MSEAVMIELTKRGMNRQDAHALMRKCSMASIERGEALAVVLAGESEVAKYITNNELENLMDPGEYLGSAAAIVDRVVKELGPLAR